MPRIAGKNPGTTVHARIFKLQKEYLDKVCERTGESQSRVISKAIECYYHELFGKEILQKEKK